MCVSARHRVLFGTFKARIVTEGGMAAGIAEHLQDIVLYSLNVTILSEVCLGAPCTLYKVQHLCLAGKQSY